MFTGIVEATAVVLSPCVGGGRAREGGGRLVLKRPRTFTDLRVGSSVCVSGVCLSVVKLERDSMTFDVVPETLRRTTLGSLKAGDRVNLERALKVGERLEGHIVQGHVDGVGDVLRVTLRSRDPALRRAQGDTERERGVSRRSTAEEKRTQAKPERETLLTISYPKQLRGLVVEKGSIAVDGVSLTVVSLSSSPELVEGSRSSEESLVFTVALIPHTLAATTLGELKAGDRARRGAVSSRRSEAKPDRRSRVNLEMDVLGRYARQ